MTDELLFFEWLDECPVSWLLIEPGDNTKTYQFFIGNIDEADD